MTGADESTVPSTGSRWESWQHCADCLDTSLLQIGISLNAVQVAAWTTVGKMTGTESRVGDPAVLAISHTTSELVQVNHTGGTAGGTMNGSMWVWVLVATSILVMGCIFYSIRMFERDWTTSPPPLASASRKGAAHTASATSLSSEWPQRGQPIPASSRSHSSAVSVPTSARRVQAGKALSMKIKSNGSSVACPLDAGSAYGKREVTPHSSLSTYADSSLSSQEPVRQKMEGSLFTLPVDTMVGVNLTGKGSFIIKDTFSSLVLKAAVPQNSDGSRNVQVFLGEDTMTPCASVAPPPLGSQPALNSFEIRGADNMLLGSLVLQNTGSFIVHAHPEQELVIEGNDADVDLHVSSPDGRPKASVSCKGNQPGGPEQVEIHVLPGTDSVLIVACTLAILFLCG